MARHYTETIRQDLVFRWTVQGLLSRLELVRPYFRPGEDGPTIGLGDIDDVRAIHSFLGRVIAEVEESAK